MEKPNNDHIASRFHSLCEPYRPVDEIDPGRKVKPQYPNPKVFLGHVGTGAEKYLSYTPQQKLLNILAINVPFLEKDEKLPRRK